MNMKKRRTIKIILTGLFIVFIILLMTTPTHEKFDKWIAKEYRINCEYDYKLGNVCYRDGEKIDFRSSHFRNTGMYAAYEIDYKYESGQIETFRTLGVLGTLFKMKDGYLWRLVNI
ncbi:hypothetical protein ACFSTH_06760 [Paenibacillus yanchengensis]|uniref:DUF4359 domain-containing protein n=1 Tax=Paenibacillus yanchengensis TaxID=2035833 RepID=A0ABW4YIZ7_9BACL